MTTPRASADPARAAEILAAYGADPLRWPDEERGDTVRALAADPALRAARTEAAQLDLILDAWASGALAGEFADDGHSAATAARHSAVAAAARALGPMPRHWRTATGGGLFAAAAAIAAAVVVMITPTTVLHSPHVEIAAAGPASTSRPVAPALTDEQAFSLLFTPTPDEEEAI